MFFTSGTFNRKRFHNCSFRMKLNSMHVEKLDCCNNKLAVRLIYTGTEIQQKQELPVFSSDYFLISF